MPLSLTNQNDAGSFGLTGTTGRFAASVTVVADSIRAFLTGSSSSSYDAAAVNTWVKVTQAEYNSVAARLSSVTKVGATDLQVNTRLIATGYNLSQTNDFTIPSDTYIFGMIIEPWNTNSSGSVGYTTTVTGSISDYNTYFGNNFVGLIGGGRNYFILKKPTTATTSTVYPFVTMSASPNGMNYEGWGWTGTIWQYTTAASNTMAKFQLLTTTNKQW
jgi:hypothetical protein